MPMSVASSADPRGGRTGAATPARAERAPAPPPPAPAVEPGLQFTTSLWLGTPAQEIKAAVDTGSSILHVACAGCKQNCAPGLAADSVRAGRVLGRRGGRLWGRGGQRAAPPTTYPRRASSHTHTHTHTHTSPARAAAGLGALQPRQEQHQGCAAVRQRRL